MSFVHFDVRPPKPGAFSQVEDSPEFLAEVDKRRQQRMQSVDDLPLDIKNLVHEYGFHIVKTCLDLNIKKANHIKHLVETILDEFSPTRGSCSIQGVRGDHRGLQKDIE